MFLRHPFWSSLISLSLLLGIAPAAIAQTHAPAEASTGQFRRIEQPFPVRIGVVLGGLGLIGLELWWFLFSKPPAQQAGVRQGTQEIEITVDGGYSPDQIVVQAGQPVRLNFFRKDPSSCLEKVILPDFHRAVDLQLNQATAIEFTPQEPGTYTFHCGMNMFRGNLEVRGHA